MYREDVNDGNPNTWVTDLGIVGTVTVIGDLGRYVAVRRRGGGGDTKTFAFTDSIPNAVTSNGDWRAIVTATEGCASINLDPGAFPVYEITNENTGTGPATIVLVTVDVGRFVSFGVDSLGMGCLSILQPECHRRSRSDEWHDGSR
jgi:hypothetical protein